MVQNNNFGAIANIIESSPGVKLNVNRIARERGTHPDAVKSTLRDMEEEGLVVADTHSRWGGVAYLTEAGSSVEAGDSIRNTRVEAEHPIGTTLDQVRTTNGPVTGEITDIVVTGFSPFKKFTYIVDGSKRIDYPDEAILGNPEFIGTEPEPVPEASASTDKRRKYVETYYDFEEDEPVSGNIEV